MARTLIGNVKGPPGNNGLTPHIGENGNWWIGETDTGVAATGSDGGTIYVSSVEDMGTYTRIGLKESKTGAVQYIEIPHGSDGERGTGILNITTAPSSYTTATGGFTPTYRIALSTVLSQSKVDSVLAGDTLAYSYYHYPVGYVDASYVYLGTRKNIRGAPGAAGTTPVKGTDYWTDADKVEMVGDVLAALPTWEGGSY